MYSLMYVCALKYARTNVKSDCTYAERERKRERERERDIYIYYNNVWIRGMEQRYGTDPSRRYGTVVVV